ncbi:hypothetical protein [Bacillus phage phiAGATE]|uniref:Uncharacterized protein n=1 Tax=Bacillus phage phiAGATE TaxID=1204533 RepID=L0LAF6_9CAUD|nr:hypothetical protein G380_gp067 [Bacillus phage phiAGATE]AGB62717.1 hypothetical protein [Bacillus phage phiAGATE]
MKLTPEMFECVPKNHPHYGRAVREAEAFFNGFKPAVTMPYPIFESLIEEGVDMSHLLYACQTGISGNPYGVVFFNNESVRQEYYEYLKEEDDMQKTVKFGQLLGYPLGASKFFARLLAGQEEYRPKVIVDFAGIQFISSRDSIEEDIAWLSRKYSMLYPLTRCQLKIEFTTSSECIHSVLEFDGTRYAIDNRPILNLIVEPLELISNWVTSCFDSYRVAQAADEI